ncbi:tumor necrosis factor ligand superfamily member 13B-like [Polyodon spathula]|uniref:tumor necrosis factor ligand superfamily member 13B-like n=1 Tax=Polyodon spathula TaxID=7913 RepID=UPI001B7E3DC1|nr:tumor necrosis factor ligand superfamily member 13B-like [Polyodon spathula]
MFGSCLEKKSVSKKLVLSQSSLSMIFLMALSCSVFLLHQVSTLREELQELNKEIHMYLNHEPAAQQHSTVHTRELKLVPSSFEKRQQYQTLNSLIRTRREARGSAKHQSFMQLKAVKDAELIQKGDITIIPWAVSVEKGESLATADNKMIVQEDGYYMVYGQVLFLNPGIHDVMGYLIQRRRSSVAGTEQRYTNLLLCLQEMPKERSTNSCYTAGVVKLDQGDELELVIPDRPNAQISMDADSTFFGVIQLM